MDLKLEIHCLGKVLSKYFFALLLCFLSRHDCLKAFKLLFCAWELYFLKFQWDFLKNGGIFNFERGNFFCVKKIWIFQNKIGSKWTSSWKSTVSEKSFLNTFLHYYYVFYHATTVLKRFKLLFCAWELYFLKFLWDFLKNPWDF